MGSLRLIVAAAAMLLACVAAPASQAYVIKGSRGRAATIRYYNAAPDQAWPVARAVYVWNHSGAGIRFVQSPLASAQLVIRHYTHNRCVDHAEATVGYGANATMWLPRIDESSRHLQQLFQRPRRRPRTRSCPRASGTRSAAAP